MTKISKAVFFEKNTDPEVQEKFDAKKDYMNPVSAAALTVSAGILLVWGLFPHQLMDRFAETAQGFMNFHPHGEPHIVAYFSFVNLKGALISIVIGVLVYLFFICKILVRRQEDTTMYVNLWPKWLDMEYLIYRPVLLQFLPFVGGILCRVLDSLVDTLVICLRKTIYKDSPVPREYKVGDGFTRLIGGILGLHQKLANRTWNRKNPTSKDYVGRVIVWEEEVLASQRIIERSLSFGLLLFCVGLGLTFIYIIWW